MYRLKAVSLAIAIGRIVRLNRVTERGKTVKTEAQVAGHYGRGGLEEKILGALRAAGVDLARVTAEELAPVDEFHVGGLEATKELAAQMELRAGMRLLDVGSGIGGPARFFAAAFACEVTGIDLTEEFVRVAESLTRLVKLQERVQFRQGSALEMPFGAETFDGAYLLHVGMNVADKAGVFREVRRVLKAGTQFTVYDMMRTGEGAFALPAPWAVTQDASFVETPARYREALQAAGFLVERERGRRAFAIEFTQRMMARMAEGGAPALGLPLLMGEKAPEMMRNMRAALLDGVLEPVEMLARAA
jgi:ubiquinone/menaquinone biosynthesis C-methylase UbiE